MPYSNDFKIYLTDGKICFMESLILSFFHGRTFLLKGTITKFDISLNSISVIIKSYE